MTKTEAGQSIAEQIAVMKSLGQAAAAWLLQVNGRTLRDHVTAPRNDNGTYDASQLLTWAAARAPRPKLDDCDWERLLQIADGLEGPREDGAEIGWSAAFTELEQRHGDAVRVLLADELVSRFHATATRWEAAGKHREFVEQQRQRKIVVVCDECGRIRRGSKWVQLSPAAGHERKPGLCPQCEATP